MTGPRQLMDLATLDRISPRANEAGLLLGRDTDRAPVLVPMLRAEPTRIALIGGQWLAKVVVFRCLAFSTRVLVRTTEPRRWEGLGSAASNAPAQVMVVPARPAVRGHVGEPVLHVADLDGHHDGELGPDDRWQTMLTVAAQLTDAAAQAVASADLVILQRMWPQQAAYIASVLGFDPSIGQQVGALPDDAVMLLGKGSQRQLWIGPTVIEQRLFGPPQRS